MNILEEEDDVTYFSSGLWLGSTLHVGDCVYINPDAYSFDYVKEVESKPNIVKEVSQ